MFNMELQPTASLPGKLPYYWRKMLKHAVNINSPFLAMQMMLLGTNEQVYLISLNFMENYLPFYLF